MARADSRLRAADLSAYPIIRVDEISFLPDDPAFFTKCTRDAYALIESIKAEKNPDRGLVEYLLRQIDLMRREQVQRNAAKRIEALLRGDMEESPTYDVGMLPIHSGNSIVSDTPTNSSPSRMSGGFQAPRVIKSSSIHEVSAPEPAPDHSRGNVLDGPAKPLSSDIASNTAPLSRSQRRASSSGSAGAEGQGESAAHSTPRRDASDSKPSESPSAASSGLSATRRRPGDDGVLSARVQESLNRSFGVEFVVAPVEKKKRFFLKKKVEVAPEEILENSRQERRKAAMQRLMDRQRQRQERREAQKAKAKKEKASAKSIAPSKSISSSTRVGAADQSTDGKDNDNPFASSDSESISGADDLSDNGAGDDRQERDVLDIIKDDYNDACNASRTAENEFKVDTLDSDAVCDRSDDPTQNEDFKLRGHISSNDVSELLASASQPGELLNAQESTVTVYSPRNSLVVDASVHVECYEESDVNKTWNDQPVPVGESAQFNPSDEDEEISYNDDVLVSEAELLKFQFNNSDLEKKLSESMQIQTDDGSVLGLKSVVRAETGDLINRSGSADAVDLEDASDDENDDKDDNNGDDYENDDGNDSDQCDTREASREGATVKRGPRLTMRSSASSDGVSQNPRRAAGRNPSVSSAGANMPSRRLSRGVKSVTSESQMARMRSGGKDTSQQISVDPNYKCPYESFDMIFSGNYGPDGKPRVARKGESFLATSTFQLMVQMAATYSEWLEIMEDYSTVFSMSEPGSSTVGSGKQNGDGANRLVYNGGSNSRHYRIKSSRSDVCNIIHDVFNQMLKEEYVELPSGYGLGVSWNLLWSWGRPKLNFSQLLVWQKVNHFPESRQLTRKDLLKKNLQALTEMGRGRKSGAYFEIMPPTYLLPNEFTAFVKAFHEFEKQRADSEMKEPNIWIMKPVGLSRGRGISLVTDVNTLQYSQASVIQRYIPNPLLLGGYKFDLRLYVLVTSVCPLEAFIYTEGFARLSTHKFTLDPQELSNKFIHLTNSSIQKQNTSGPSKDNPLSNTDDAVVGGSKMSLTGQGGLWNLLSKLGVDSEAVWTNIKELVIKSLVAVEDKMYFQPNCFEVFGFDVLIDEDLRPWLIEVNASPSLSRDNPLDFRVKNAMIYDTIKLIDAAPFDRAGLVAVLKRRLQAAQSNPGQSASAASARNDPRLAADMVRILGNYTPRTYGEMPKYLGNYERLCPNSKVFERAMAMKSKIFRSGPNSATAVKSAT